MAIELHHLHPGHDDDLSRLKARIAELEVLNHDLCERVTENDEIRLHWEEIEQTRAENERMKASIAELEKENAELKANQTWIKPSDKLPNENQEIEFIIRRKLFDDDDGVRMRVLGVYKQMFLNSTHCIFYASAPGWGSEFLPKEVEYWMPKIPMPQPPEDGK